jgi:L-aspartate oxidase
MCDCRAVDVVCQEGAARVLELVSMGADFTRGGDGALHLTKEGGHSARRIVHAADTTGAEISRTLIASARAHPGITLFEHHMCVDLCVADCDSVPHCFGVDVLDIAADSMVRIVALSTMLASGGAGQLYPSTTNPSVATGDGIAMAWRANAHIANMEFIQFHPTALGAAPTAGRSFLISEAVRGEGGRLLNLAGERFMEQYDRRLELAPRDVVARAIHDQVTRRGEPHVLLDISHKPAAEILAHFPNIAAKCSEIGIDITRDPIPVIPAQHYLCGGVSTGLLGETSVKGLFACGEVACTGLHGANRLASNSLLEGLVFASRAVQPSASHAEHVQRSCTQRLQEMVDGAVFLRERAARRPSTRVRACINGALAELKATMWAAAGIERSDSGMADGLSRLAVLDADVAALVATYGVSRELLELHNLLTCAHLVLASALSRRESRGLHFNKDYPESRDACAAPTVLLRHTEWTDRPETVHGASARVPIAMPARQAGLTQNVLALR